MKYARYHHENASLIGLYDDAVHSSLPSRTVAITDELWRTLLTEGHKYIYNLTSEEWELAPPTFDSIQEMRAVAERRVDSIAEAKRAEYLTLTGGQDTIYVIKYDEAVAFLAAGGNEEDVEDYPYVKAEWDAMEIVNANKPPAEVAQDIIDKRNQCVAIGAHIERERRSAKERIAREDTQTEIDDIVEYARTQIQEIGS